MPTKKKVAPPDPPDLGEITQDWLFREALLEAQKSLPSILKDAWNDRQKYPYTSAEQMIRSCRTHLNAHGFLFTILGWSVGEQSIADNDGVARQALELTAELSHIPSRFSREYSIPWPLLPGRGRDAGKAVASSITTPEAYLLKSILAVDRTAPGEELDDVPGSNVERADYSHPDWDPYRKRLVGLGTTLEELAAELGEPLDQLQPNRWLQIFTNLEMRQQTNGGSKT